MSSHESFESRAFGKDVFVYSTGQGILLVFSVVLAFIIPKHLSVAEYGYWHFFILYSAFTSILHLGFNDGLLIRWAGKDLSEIGKELRSALFFLVLQQIVFCIPLGLFLWIFFRPPLVWVVLFILVFALINNIAYFFQYASQAVKRFKGLMFINVGRGLSFLVLVIVVISTDRMRFHSVITVFLLSHLLLLLAFLVWYRKYLSKKKAEPLQTWAYGKENIHTGFFILLGNLILILFLTMDRLIVGSFFPVEQFAVFAFAVAVTNIVFTFVKAVSDVFFPFISGTDSSSRIKAYQQGETAIIFIWSGFILFYFPIEIFIEKYLSKYTASLPILKILLCTVGFGSLIFILHVNYYKLYRRQRQYFLRALLALAISIGLNFIAIFVFGTLGSVAVATFISFGIWYAINEWSFRQILSKKRAEFWRNFASIMMYIGAFWASVSMVEGVLLSCLVYALFFCLITRFFHWREIKKMAISFKEIAASQGSSR